MHAAKTRSHHPGGSDSPPTHDTRHRAALALSWVAARHPHSALGAAVGRHYGSQGKTGQKSLPP